MKRKTDKNNSEFPAEQSSTPAADPGQEKQNRQASNKSSGAQRKAASLAGKGSKAKKEEKPVVEKPMDNEREMSNELKELIGERLNTIRRDLEKNTGEKLTLKLLAPRIGIQLGILQRIVDGKGGGIESYLIVFNYYLNKGYNLNWIIARDNSQFSMYRVPDGANFNGVEQILTHLERIRNQISSSVEDVISRTTNDILTNSALLVEEDSFE